MDSFAVSVESADVWGTSHLVEEMKWDYHRMPRIPVIVDGYVWFFDELGGGYDDGHVVRFTQSVDNQFEAPSSKGDCYEAHLRDTSYTLWTEDVDWYQSDGELHILVRVDDYRTQEHTFWKELINGEYE